MTMKSTIVVRASIALALGLFIAGVALGGFALGAEGQSTPTPPAPALVAYVDFLSLLKDDPVLKVQQANINNRAYRDMLVVNARAPEFEALVNKLRTLVASDRQYTQTKQQLLDLHLNSAQQKAEIELAAQGEVRAAVTEAYTRLRRLVAEIASQRGYNQVLNIVRNPEKVAEAQDDLRVLQQQMLLSPVIYHEQNKDRDLTDIVAEKVKREYGVNIKLELLDACTLTAEDKDDKPVKRMEQDDKKNADKIDWEVRLGQKLRLKVKVTDKDKPAEGDNAGVYWARRGFMTGDMKDDGTYIAQATFPKTGDKETDIVTVVVRSNVDSTQSIEVRLRLLDKDGNRLGTSTSTDKPKDPSKETPKDEPKDPPKETPKDQPKDK